MYALLNARGGANLRGNRGFLPDAIHMSDGRPECALQTVLGRALQANSNLA